jgi:tetratricopeptide (TPR) repeat protein
MGLRNRQMKQAITISVRAILFLLVLSPVCWAAGGITQTTNTVRNGEDEVRFNQGRLAYYNGQFNNAAAAFVQCISDNPQDAAAHYYLGLTLTAQDEPLHAIDEFNRALTLDPTLVEAHAGRASAEIKAKDYDAANADINALASDPQWADTVAFLRGQLAYAKGDYRTAAASFSKARSAGGSEASAAGLYEGLSYVQLKELGRAQAALQAVTRINPDSSSASAARALGYSLQTESNVRPFALQVSSGYEWDSNVPQTNWNSPLPPNTRRQQDGRFVVEPQASLSLIRTSNLDAGVDTIDYFSWQNQDGNYNIDSWQVGAFGTYHIATNSFLGLRYDFNDVTQGYAPSLKRNVVTPQFTCIEPNLGYTAVYYQFEARQFDQPAPTPALERDGKTNELGLIQGIDLKPASIAGLSPPRLEIDFRYENDQTSGSDYDGNFVTLGGTYYQQVSHHAYVDAGLDWTNFAYSHFNSLDPTVQRTDYELKPHIGVTYQIGQNWAFRGDYTFTYHVSNVVNNGVRPYQFNENVIGVRLIFTY